MKNLITALAVTAAATMGYAGDDHNHEAAIESAPHGGTLRDAPPFKVELVLNGDKAKLHVYDAKLKPVKLDKPTLSGHLRFPKDKNEKKVEFKNSGGAYEATLTGISKVHRYDLHIDLIVGDKKVVADFGVDNIH